LPTNKQRMGIVYNCISKFECFYGGENMESVHWIMTMFSLAGG